MRLLVGAGVLATATACGGKKVVDPYTHSLAQRSEHIEARGTVLAAGLRPRFTESGDFTNSPDRGRLSFHFRGGTTFQEVVTKRAVYIRLRNRWLRVPATRAPASLQSPAELFRAHYPARIEGGLVRSVRVHTAKVDMSVDFSRYGEHVSVTIPRVKGSK